MRIGVTLSATGAETVSTVARQARHAEECGLESVWRPDHLVGVMPFLDSTLVLTAAATATERLGLGFGVMVAALRGPAWAAKQIATLQLLSGGRVLLGVGSGGAAHGETAWRAVGVPFADRGRHTDATLELLPGLIEGRRTVVNGEPVALEPKATVPPVLIGGYSKAAVRRTAWYGDEWYPAWLPARLLADDMRRIGDLAESVGRPAPGLSAAVATGIGRIPPSAVDRQLSGFAGSALSERDVRDAMALGDPPAVAERYSEFAAIGAGRIVAMPFGGDWFRQVEELGEVARLVG